MTRRSLAARVAALEEKVGPQTMEAQFRGQAELIDRLFAANFGELDRKWDAKLDEQLRPIKSDLGILREGMKIILAKL